MPESSPEIEQVLRDVMDAIARSDLDEIGRRTSRDACALSIGSDPSEWAEGYEQIMRLFRDSTPQGELSVTAGLGDVKRSKRAASAGLPAMGTSRSRVRVSRFG